MITPLIYNTVVGGIRIAQFGTLSVPSSLLQQDAVGCSGASLTNPFILTKNCVHLPTQKLFCTSVPRVQETNAGSFSLPRFQKKATSVSYRGHFVLR